MENREQSRPSCEHSTELLPSLIKSINEGELPDFDGTVEQDDASGFGVELVAAKDDTDPFTRRRVNSISISMPPSPVETHVQNKKRVLFRDDAVLDNDIPASASALKEVSSHTKATRFYSQPMPKDSSRNEAISNGKSSNLPRGNPRIDRLRDNRFDSFKTWSGKLERQFSNLRGKRPLAEQDLESQLQPKEIENVPVDRYFDALEGPELDKLRASEEILLPDDKLWPFLLRFPISSFGICLGVSSQAIMWKTLASVESTKFLHVNKHINLVLWCISVALLMIVAIIYALKLIFYFEAVRREYYHPIRVNFFFAPWISLLFLFIGIPPSIAQTLHEALWYILMIPFLCLELKIYGQWMSGGQRRLSKVANPSNHLSIVGNFVGALLGASMGLKEGPIFFFAIGLAHYIVLFVTLYQRLPTNETLPKELHPVFFLFVAAPSVASMAWARIQGSFDNGSRIAYFIAMFLYFSLATRINFFRGFRFSLAWWAYTFPMTGAAIATIRYSEVVTNTVTRTFSVLLCILAMLTVAALFVTTIVHAFILHDLFPNDISIAISERRPKTASSHRRWYHMRSGSSDANIEQYLKFSTSDDKEINNKECSSTKEEKCEPSSKVLDA